MRLIPSGEKFSTDRRRRQEIEVCGKCLYTLRLWESGYRKLTNDAAEDVFLFGHWCWICLDTEKCAARQDKNKERHRKEIEGRLRRGRGIYTHLIVVQDLLGFAYGYGNCYVSVVAGEDMQEIAAKYSICRDLVVESILRVEPKDEKRKTK